MKKLIFTTFLSMVVMMAMTAQVSNNTQTQTKGKAKTGEQVKTQTDTHGQTVSTVAKETPSGPGKGQIVSTEAKTNGEVKQAANQEKKDVKNQAKETEKGKSHPAKGHKGAKPAASGNHGPKGGPKVMTPGKK